MSTATRIAHSVTVGLSATALAATLSAVVITGQLRGGVSQEVVPDANQADPIVRQSVQSLRKDAADGTGAPQVGADPNIRRACRRGCPPDRNTPRKRLLMFRARTR